MKSTTDLIQLAGLGVNLTIDAKTKSTTDLIQIAGIIRVKGTNLTLTSASSKSTTDLIQLSGLLIGNLNLDFNDPSRADIQK